jgi:hypothetical protein
MSLLDHLMGVSRKGMHSGVIPKISFAREDVTVVIYDFPYYQHPDHPEEKLQDNSFVTLIGREIPIYQGVDGKPLYLGLRGFQSYDVTVLINDRASPRFQFRIDRHGEPYELIKILFDAIDGAFKSSGVRFLRMRK